MLFVIRVCLNLIVSRELIHKGHPFKPTHVVNHGICDWKGELIFRTRLIQITEINANSDLSILLGDEDDISH